MSDAADTTRFPLSANPPLSAWTKPCSCARGPVWCDRIEWATLDLSGHCRAVFEDKLPRPRWSPIRSVS